MASWSHDDFMDMTATFSRVQLLSILEAAHNFGDEKICFALELLSEIVVEHRWTCMEENIVECHDSPRPIRDFICNALPTASERVIQIQQDCLQQAKHHAKEALQSLVDAEQVCGDAFQLLQAQYRLQEFTGHQEHDLQLSAAATILIQNLLITTVKKKTVNAESDAEDRLRKAAREIRCVVVLQMRAMQQEPKDKSVFMGCLLYTSDAADEEE